MDFCRPTQNSLDNIRYAIVIFNRKLSYAVHLDVVRKTNKIFLEDDVLNLYTTVLGSAAHKCVIY